MVRVHDVGPSVRVARVADAISRGWSEPPEAWTPVYLGLGANLGDRAATIATTLRRLEDHHDIRVVRRASLCETAPWGVAEQPPFLNTVVEAITTLSPQALLERAKTLEHDLGRQARERWGPREIDVDILLYGEVAVQELALTVPHPRIWERRFVLAPLAELRPELVGPDGRPIAEHLSDLDVTQTARSLGW
jgi:2-amino-4-hydroxy-6-hydroxymethyldihydropteridine diphosphokinase